MIRSIVLLFLFIQSSCATGPAQKDLLSNGRAANVRSPANEIFEYRGVDITPLVNFARQHTFTLHRSFTAYNWSLRPDFQSQIPANGTIAIEFARSFAEVYWIKQFTERDNASTFGAGFYLASDPVVSRGFGGKPRNPPAWVLTSIDFPVGLRVFDWSGYDTDANSEQVNSIMAVMKNLGCNPGYASKFPEILMAPKGQSSSNMCVEAFKGLFTELNPIEVFAYHYESSDFPACVSAEHSALRSESFVVTSGAWLKPEFVKVFNHNTSADLLDRHLIQNMHTFWTRQEEEIRAKKGDPPPRQLEQYWADTPFESAINVEELNAFQREHIFACDGNPPYSK